MWLLVLKLAPIYHFQHVSYFHLRLYWDGCVVPVSFSTSTAQKSVLLIKNVPQGSTFYNWYLSFILGEFMSCFFLWIEYNFYKQSLKGNKFIIEPIGILPLSEWDDSSRVWNFHLFLRGRLEKKTKLLWAQIEIAFKVKSINVLLDSGLENVVL
jgi:hypothetical protein